MAFASRDNDGLSSVQTSMNKFFECSICLDVEEPKILECEHKMCLKCLGM